MFNDCLHSGGDGSSTKGNSGGFLTDMADGIKDMGLKAINGVESFFGNNPNVSVDGGFSVGLYLAKSLSLSVDSQGVEYTNAWTRGVGLSASTNVSYSIGQPVEGKFRSVSLMAGDTFAGAISATRSERGWSGSISGGLGGGGHFNYTSGHEKNIASWQDIKNGWSGLFN